VKTFNEIYLLNEKSLSIKKENEVLMIGQEKISDELNEKLFKIKRKSNWKLFDPKRNYNNALELVEDSLFGNNECYLILSNDGEIPIGHIRFKSGNSLLKTRGDIYTVAFQQNNITFIKDIINLMKLKIKQNGKLEWSVLYENPIKEAYNKLVSKWGGKIEKGPDSTTLYTVTRKNLKDNLNET